MLLPDERHKQFIHEHQKDDPARLLLSASRYPGIDIPFVVEQISARKQVRDKLPEWYNNEKVVYPSKIAAEQCSSELTAKYKQRLVGTNECVTDLTGGMGVDSFYFSRKAKEVTYIERFASYCEAARSNFLSLDAYNIYVREGNVLQLPDGIPPADIYYIDPARRGEGNKRVYALADCEPDLIALLPKLWKKDAKVIAKISPMADIREVRNQLPDTTEIHVVSVKNECKELLFVLERDRKVDQVPIYCINYPTDSEETSFVFYSEEEKETLLNYTSEIKKYLYEPNASILKAGAFKQVAVRFELEKPAASSHLYTSERELKDFPGRRFLVEEVMPFTGRWCKTISKTLPKANLTVRNFPLTVEELRKRTKIKEGGDIYLFATTTADGEKIMVKTRKIS